MSHPKTFAVPGSALAAYRSAMARVEPGEAFLARTRQAIYTEAAGCPPAEKAAGAPRRQRAWQPGPGFKRRGVRRLAPLAACLALALLALPAAYHLLDGAGASGGTPMTAYQTADAADTAGEEGMAQSSAAAAEFDDSFMGTPGDTPAAGDAPAEAPAAAEGNPQTSDAAPPEGGPERAEEPSSAWSGAKTAGAERTKHTRG